LEAIIFMGYAKLSLMSETQLARHIRSLAKESLRVLFTKHMKARMKQRKVGSPEVFECIRNGTLRRPPEASSDGCNLECRMERYVAGRNLAVLVALSDENPDIILVTVFWID
jgi:hypothetical protein